MKRTELKRSSSLRRANAPQRRGKAPREGLGRDTAGVVYRRQNGLCCCGCGDPIAPFPIGYHHVFPKAKWPSLVDVAANVAGTAENCHANHEAASRRLPRWAIAFAEGLAVSPAMRSYLDRIYGLRRA